MTVAICWKCGAQKLGALTVCAGCGVVPESPRDKATSILLSDHYRSLGELETLAQGIARGEEPEVDPDELENTAALVRAAPKLPWGCTVVVWIPFVVLFILVLVVGWLIVTGAYR